jgi:hypothetical protein
MQAAWFFDRRRAIDRQRANERLAGESTKAALRLVFAVCLFARLQSQPFSRD